MIARTPSSPAAFRQVRIPLSTDTPTLFSFDPKSVPAPLGEERLCKRSIACQLPSFQPDDCGRNEEWRCLPFDLSTRPNQRKAFVAAILAKIARPQADLAPLPLAS
jgi:hypothetical protein